MIQKVPAKSLNNQSHHQKRFKKIGIIGGGQLAQMLALAAHPLGIKTICLEPQENCPAALVTDVIVGDYADPEKLQLLATEVDLITYEFENVPVSALNSLTQVPIYPATSALEIAQDRLHEKRFFDQLNVPTTHYFPVDSLQHLNHAFEHLGAPLIVKTRRLGYDGKGQYVVRTQQELEQAWQDLKGQSLLVENWVSFDREISCIAVRSLQGEVVFYPLIVNEHQQGILRLSQVVPQDKKIITLAHEYMNRILSTLDYVGVLTVEFFQKGEELIANEIAPRVHNSGHWTIEGAQISQFENHLRAIMGLPLGPTAVLGNIAMLNLIGKIPDLAEILKVPEAHCHLYGKEPRAGRKLGHVTICIEDEEVYTNKLEKLKTLCF